MSSHGQNDVAPASCFISISSDFYLLFVHLCNWFLIGQECIEMPWLSTNPRLPCDDNSSSLACMRQLRNRVIGFLDFISSYPSNSLYFDRTCLYDVEWELPSFRISSVGHSYESMRCNAEYYLGDEYTPPKEKDISTLNGQSQISQLIVHSDSCFYK